MREREYIFEKKNGRHGDSCYWNRVISRELLGIQRHIVLYIYIYIFSYFLI